MSELILDSY